MLPELLQTTNLFKLLHRIDIDLADQSNRKLVAHFVEALCIIPITSVSHVEGLNSLKNSPRD